MDGKDLSTRHPEGLRAITRRALPMPPGFGGGPIEPEPANRRA
jgi:hypothetical protein